MAIYTARLQKSSDLLESLKNGEDFSHFVDLHKLLMMMTFNLLLQVADNLPCCDPFSYENSMFLCYQILCHIYYTDIP
jgi:hypothetical protein